MRVISPIPLKPCIYSSNFVRHFTSSFNLAIHTQLLFLISLELMEKK